MPIIKSAKKRVKVAAKANTRNVRTKRAMREALKAFSKAVSSGKPSEITKTQNAAISAIDKAAKKAVIHKNKAAHLKAQLSVQAKASGVKPAKPSSKPKDESKKLAAKKTTPKKTSTKVSSKKSSAKNRISANS